MEKMTDVTMTCQTGVRDVHVACHTRYYINVLEDEEASAARGEVLGRTLRVWCEKSRTTDDAAHINHAPPNGKRLF